MKDIHNYDLRLESSLKGTEAVSNRNQKLIREFIHKCELEELSKCRLGKYAYLLTRISKWLNKDLDKVSKKEIEDLVLKVSKEYTNAWTIKDYKVIIKKFYRSIGKEDYISWIKTTIKRNNNEDLPNEVYSLEEVEKLIETASDSENKALISVLYESGCRVSELLNIKIKDINFENDYALVNVMGKTGNRTIPLSKCVPLLKTWLNYHEDKDNKEAYVFNIKYRTLFKKLKVLFENAKIEKPYNPHQFRHSRATELAKQLTEAQMNQFFGWTQASRMASTYVHLSGRDLIPQLITKNKTKKCFKCGFENPVDLTFCSKCLMPLDSKEFNKKQKDLKYDKLMYEVSKDQRFAKLVLEIALKKGLIKMKA